MFFLLRTAFWISLLLLVLPFGGAPKSDGPTAKDRASIDAMAALAAAGSTISDVGGFCGRQPDACEVGGQALKLVGERARDGATALSGYFAQGSDAKPQAGTDIRTGAATPAPGRQTLSATDRKPAWRGPAA